MLLRWLLSVELGRVEAPRHGGSQQGVVGAQGSFSAMGDEVAKAAAMATTTVDDVKAARGLARWGKSECRASRLLL